MPVSEIRIAAMNILARREHSVAELKSKLGNKFVDREEVSIQDIDKLIAELIQDNLLNDERFAELFVKGRVAKGFGPVKIAYELSQKKIDSETIEKYLYLESDIWLEKLQQQRIKKFGAEVPDNLKEKSRQYRYLYQRGYSAEQINQILN